VYLSAPAIAPLHADRKKIYRNALIVLLAGILFALAAALIAHNLDPRIYIAADVERVLGFAPMALLPDLYEVGTGVAEEYMLRLSAAVEHAHQQGHLNSCIFTGVAPGAGASTVATRVSNMLQAMGRSTALVDAVGTAPAENDHAGSGLVHMPRGSRSTALLQQVTAGNDETIVVTDTAPLTISAETEYLARFVDSAIVVIESGTTTKAQLREVAQTLERLDVSAVGFVLNRISMAKGNAAFCRSVHAVERHLKAQARTFDRRHSRGAAPAGDTAEVAEPPEEKHGRKVAAQPANSATHAAAAEDEPRSRKERVAAHETMFVNHPHVAVDDGPVAETAAIQSPKSWEAESFMSPEKGDSSPVEGARRETHAFEIRAEEADGFLPWETWHALAHREKFARSARAAYERESVGIGTETLDEQSTSDAIAEDADLIASEWQAPEELATEPVSAVVLQETVADLSESQAYASVTAESGVSPDLNQPVLETLQAAEQTAPADKAATQDDSEATCAQGWKAIPAKPARGREGVPVVLGGPRTAPLTGEEVPEKWREMLQSEAEVAYPAVSPEEQGVFSPESLQTAQVRTDPFDAMREAGARRAPLVEWWEELTASAKQAPVADAPRQATAAPPAVEQAGEYAAAEQAAESVVAPKSEQDEALSHAASRLSGLRNLLVTLGIETLHQGMEQRKAESEARTAKLQERAIFAQPAGPAGNGKPTSDSVTARGEIMPPRPPAETAQREKTPKAPKTPLKSPRVSSWESPDDVDILPSRRGQYRRSR
jgi:hypothetical protein